MQQTTQHAYRHRRMTETSGITERLRVFPDILCLVLITLMCWAGLHIWRLSSITKIETSFDFQPQTSKPMSKKQIQEIRKRIPRVTELDCKDFLIPPETWNKSQESMAWVIPKPERDKTPTYYEDCYAVSTTWMEIPVSDLERKNPIAFSIMIYDNVDRFARLLRAIYRTSNVYCVHIDKKSSSQFKAIVGEIVSCFENVFIAKTSIPVYWGQRSVLNQEIICLKELWKQKVKWRWVINLTGEEFPLKTNLELVHILMSQQDFNDVSIDPCTEDGPQTRNKLTCRRVTRARFTERWVDSSQPPLYVQPYKGQIHVVLSRAMVDYVLHNEGAKAIYNWSLTTEFGDEIFFATLNGNVHLKAPGSNAVFSEHPLRMKPSFARLKFWYEADSWPYCNFYLRSVCVLTPRELPLMMNSLQLFANKFKSYHQPIGYACLEEWYFNTVVRELETGRVQLDLRIYHNLFYMHLGF